MATVWQIDPAHTTAEFSVRHMMISNVRGRFGKVEGTVTGDLSDPTQAQIEAKIDAASIDTRNEQRDQHLRSADFFDVEHHPYITFKSRRIERVGDNAFKVVGDLTIRGVTREVVLDAIFQGQAKSPWGQQVAGFSATTKLNRKDFGLTWNTVLETGGVLVGDEVNVEIQTELIQQA
ncbi:MAG TPA: YceI family protein [Limnochorda sp.]